MKIREDDLSSETIARLLRTHLDDMKAITPEGSVHALDLDALRTPEVTFWSAWDGEALLGCGALQELDARTGEIKSMRTAEAHRGKGVGWKILEHIVHEAKSRGYDCLNLETGSLPAFASARAFYERQGFEYRGPFGEYREDLNSVFMTKKLTEPTGS